jgi:predicted TPR repeat methyltransferase
MQVMDFGAGTGLISSHIAPLVDKIWAVDVSAAMLERLADKDELRGRVEPVCADILSEPLGRMFDVVMSAMALHHVEDTGALLARLGEHLQPGGWLALADLDREDGSFHPPDTEGVFHHGFEREALAALLERAGFSQIEFATAAVVNKDDRRYPVFLVTAVKA